MKKIIIAIIMVAASVLARAETVTVTWDLNDPAENVTSYQLSVDGLIIWEGAAPPAAVDIDAGAHIFELRAKNERGISEPALATLPALPKSPSGVTILLLSR